MLDIASLTMHITHPVTRERTDILHDITLRVGTGEAVGLVGESGSGKSMTLKSVLGIEPSSAEISGTITLDGVNLRTQTAEDRRRTRAQDLALIAQDPHGAVNPVLRVEQYLVEGIVDAQGGSASSARDQAAGLLADVGIHEPERVLRSYPHQLSGGMLQRVVIAGAISGHPKVLLADEPTTALDVTTQAQVMAILDEKRREGMMSMLFVTHDLDLAASVCDRLAVMRFGEIVEIGSPEQIRDNPQHEYTKALMAARPLLHPPASHPQKGSSND